METDQDPLLGALLDGRYQIVSLLGRGGMGNVYLAEETRLRRRCALKVLHPQLTADRSHVERFLREAQMIAQLEHPNIVDIYSYGEEPSGVVFFAMELLQGEDLDARIKARAQRPYTVHDACMWALQIARAVAVVHDAGLIHRDLKTSNVFLARRKHGDEIIKLLDFGIARPEDSSDLTQTGVALGTPSYMAPEQIRSLAVDRRVDIYSFGVVLFKLLTGQVPFTGDTIQVAMQHCNSPPPRPSVVAPGAAITPALEAIVFRAMAKQPGERFQSMLEVEQALVAVLQAEAPELASAGTSTRIRTLAGAPSPALAGPASGPVAVVTPSSPAPTSTVPPTSQSAARTDPDVAMRSATDRRMPWWLPLVTLASATGLVAVLTVGGQERAPTSADAATPVNVDTAHPDLQSTFAPQPPIPAREPAAQPPAVPPPSEPAAELAADPPLKPDTTPNLPADSQPRPVPVDPIKLIKRKAQACRRQHDAVGGPAVTVDYAIGLDGKVTRSIPSTQDELGKCLADAVRQAQFARKFALGLQITL